jgi:hypothetical protein
MRIFAATLLFAFFFLSTAAAQSLDQGFRSPPASARPHTWWHWMNGNVTKEGITADLAAMKEIGISGAQIFNVSEGIPVGPIAYMSPEWLALVKHAATEAERFGIELCMHNCAGWSSSGGPWNTPEFGMQMVTTSEIEVEGPKNAPLTIAQPPSRLDYYRDIAVLAFPTPADATSRIPSIREKAGWDAPYGLLPHALDLPPAVAIDPATIVDLTGKLSAEGTLDWNVPAGRWTILRIGHTPTGRNNHPSPDSGRGLEVDKLSRAAFDHHWKHGIEPVLATLGPLAGKVLNNLLIDSYEVGSQNWTKDFAVEFKKRRGYDIVNFLPVLTGRVVETNDASERFLFDFRRTIADLFNDNYYDYFSELCKKRGIQASIEPYDGPFECLAAARTADIVMGEFWIGGGETNSVKLAASTAHIWGKKIVGAESFTAVPEQGKWLNHPGNMKAIGDLIYCEGVNRFIIHRYAHQPFENVLPGMTMGQWGTHFERTTTWWKPGKAWVDYLARCQFMLQQGLFVADVAFVVDEGVPSHGVHLPDLKREGFDYDAISPEVLTNRAAVKDGRIVLPDGMSYAALVFAPSDAMSPRLLSRMRDLVRDGATVVARKPMRTIGRTLPDDEKAFSAIADELFGKESPADGATIRFGKGRIISGVAQGGLRKELGLSPDVQFSTPDGKAVTCAWIHRKAGDADIYFVSHQRKSNLTIEMSFRAEGRIPEFFDPLTGAIEEAPIHKSVGGRTVVTRTFDPSGSVFVVLRRKSADGGRVVAFRAASSEETPKSPAIVVKNAVYEATDGAGSKDVTERVKELLDGGETAIGATNGNFGDPTPLHVKRLRVDFEIGGKPSTLTAVENDVIQLADVDPVVALPQVLWSTTANRLSAHVFAAGEITLGGKSAVHAVAAPPDVIDLSKDWTIEFPMETKAPLLRPAPTLSSWTESNEPNVKFFSGTAIYRKSFEIPEDRFASDLSLWLELGRVRELCEVTLNGQSMGVLWTAPFRIDIGKFARPGKNDLTIAVTNLWVNRLIGDEEFPDDCTWNGITLAAWPKWFVEKSPRPSAERTTFTTWKHWKKGQSPMTSGLLGPVTLRSARVVAP